MNREKSRPIFSPTSLNAILAKVLPELIRVDPSRALQLLANKLDSAIAVEVPSSLRAHTSSWRASIANEPQFVSTLSLSNVLINRLREAVAEILVGGFLSTASLRDALWNRENNIYRRIVIAVLAEHGNRAEDWVREVLLDQSAFADLDLQIEYWSLARNFLGTLPTADRQLVVQWILSDGCSTISKFAERGAYLKTLKRDRLFAILEHLDVNARSDFDELVQELGDARDLTEGNWPRAVAFGPGSPVSDDFIATASVDAIVSKLIAWNPPEAERLAFDGPSPEGVARQLRLRASRSPEDFFTRASLLLGLEATYLRGVVHGLDDALRAGKTLDWAQTLDLCTWIAARPSETYEPFGFMGRDPDWTWAKRAVAGLLLDGLTLGDRYPPPLLQKQLWEPLHLLADDPDPEGAHAPGSGHSSYANQAVNSVRGVAISAVIMYARWRHRNQFGDEAAPADFHAMSSFPEVKDVLDRHLDGSVDNNPIIRAVYGQHFSLLAAIDGEWAKGQVHSIFGDDPYIDELHTAAWDAYLTFCDVTVRTFSLLKEQYRFAAGRLAQTRVEALPERYDDIQPLYQLAEHIFVHALFATDTSLETDDLLGTLMAAPGPLRAHIMSYAGSYMRSEQPEELVLKLTGYVDRRVAAASASGNAEDYKKELHKLGAWYLEFHGDYEWLLARTLDVLRIVGSIETPFAVIEAMVPLTKNYPGLVLDCLEIIASDTTDPWNIMGSQQNIREILDSALGTGDAVVPQVNRIASHMIRRGWLDFREL